MSRPDPARRERLHLPALLGVVLGLIGLVPLAYGILNASPVVSFGTTEEISSERAGRQAVYLAGALLVVAATLVAGRIGTRVALALAAPGVVCALLVAFVPESAFGLLAFLVLGPAAVLALASRLVRSSTESP